MPPIMRRQGDVLLVELDELPSQLVPVRTDYGRREKGRVVLARGDATGHAHVLEGEAELLMLERDHWQATRPLEEMEERFLRVQAESSLFHEEHSTVAVPSGNYRVVRQREYAPRVRRFVAD